MIQTNFQKQINEKVAKLQNLNIVFAKTVKKQILNLHKLDKYSVFVFFAVEMQIIFQDCSGSPGNPNSILENPEVDGALLNTVQSFASRK